MIPPLRHDLPPPFYQLGEDIFENLCRDLFSEQENIKTCERYGKRGQAQHGIDLLAYCVDPDKREVGQCKCYENFTPADIRKASKKFLDNEKKWESWNVKRFILFVACEMSTTQHQEQIRKEKRRFKKRGIKYEAWSSNILRQKLRPYPGIVANYISGLEYWLEKICGRKWPDYETPQSPTSDQEFLNFQIDQLSAALSSSKTKEIDDFRELVREGKAIEAFKRVRKLRESTEWTVLNSEIKADMLVFESSLVLRLEDDFDKARELVKQSQQIYPKKDLTIIKTLLRYHEKGPEKALNEIEEPKCIEEFNLKSALLLELHKSTDIISLLKGLPQELSLNAETRRLLALSYLFRNKIPQAQHEIQKAVEERPNWLSIRISSAIINYYSALSPAILPRGIQALPEPVEWYFIKRDDESLKRLNKAEETFHKLIKDTKDDPKVRKNFQIWRLACLFNHPDRQTDADKFCRDLLADYKRHPLVVIWATTRNIHYDYSEYEVEFKRLIKNNTVKIDQIIALLLIYLFSDRIKEAIELLNQTKEYFSEANDKFLWPFWNLQTLLRSGDMKTALIMLEDSDYAHFRKEILILGLKYLDPKSEDGQHFMNAAEALFEEIGDGNFLFQICILKAREGEWDYIALHEKTLIKSVMTSEALRLVATALLNKGQFERCLNLLDDSRHFFTSNVLSQDLRRMRIKCQIELGLLPQALLEAEKGAISDPSFENLMSLFDAQITHGDRWGMIGTARKLLFCQDADSSALLHAARLVHLEHHNLAVKLFLKALKHGLQDTIIPEAHMLGIYLGLDDKIGHLAEKMLEFAKSGKAGVQSIGLNDLVNLQKQRARETNRMSKLYETGSAPVHFISERLGIPLSTLYLERRNKDIALFYPLRQPPVFCRHGARILPENHFQLDSSSRVVLDITSYLMSAHIDILDKVEDYFKTLCVSPILPTALIFQKDLLANNQPWQVAANKNLLELYDSGKINIISNTGSLRKNTLEIELGSDRAYMLQKAREKEGYLVDFLPLKTHDLNFKLIKLSYEDGLKVIDCLTLIEFLFQNGHLSKNDYKKALKNLAPEGKLQTPLNIPDEGKRLFLSNNIPQNLLRIGVLEKICDFFKVYIIQSDLDTAKAEIMTGQKKQNLIDLLGNLIDRLNDGIQTGKYESMKVLLRDNDGSNLTKGMESPDSYACVHLLKYSPKENDVICVDDRYLNSYMTRDHIVPIIGINEILLSLKRMNHISDEDYYKKILSLRVANFRYIPINSHEIIYHFKKASINDGSLIETEALTVIRRYIAACLLDVNRLQLLPIPNGPNPKGEIPFILKNERAITDVLLWVWENSETEDIALARSDWLLECMYVGISGVRHLSHALKSQDNSLELIGLDLTGLVSKGVNLVGKGKLNQDTRLSLYLKWLNSRMLQKRFLSDPNSIKTMATSLKSFFKDLHPKEDSDELKDASMAILIMLFEEIPQKIKDELAADTDFMSYLGLKASQTVNIGTYTFEARHFYSALANVANGSESTLREFKTSQQFVIKPDVQANISTNTFILSKEKNKEERREKNHLYQLLKHDISEREAFLKDNRKWFDCEQHIFEDTISKIVSTEDPWLRVQQTGDWHTTSGASYYEDISFKIKHRIKFNLDNLLPPDGEGLLRHLRLTSFFDKDCHFSEMLQESSVKLIQEEGLKDTLERLSGLPVKFPPSIFNEFSKVEDSEKLNLLNSLKMICYSPVSRIHLLHLALYFTNGNDDLLDFSHSICDDLTGYNKGFTAFKVMLQWIYDEFCLWPDTKNWSPSIFLAMSWTHTNKIYNILAKERVPIDFIMNLFAPGARVITPEIFNRNPELWNDICHPRHLKRAQLVVTGLASALEKSENQKIERADFRKYIQEIAFKLVGGVNYPAPELLLNISLATNVLNSYVGINRNKLKGLLGDEVAEQLTAEKLNDLTSNILIEIEKGQNPHKSWPILNVIISDLPVNETFSQKLKSIIKNIDIDILKDMDPVLATGTLLAITTRLPTIEDNSIRLKARKEVVRLAQYYATQKPNIINDSTLNEDLSLDVKSIFLEYAWSASVISEKPEETCNNFASLLMEMINVWPNLGAVYRPVIFKLVKELPVSQSKNLWRLLLVARAY